jgi:hypothetical protein
MITNEFNKTVAEQIFGRKTKLVPMVGHDLTNHLNSKRWDEYCYSDLEPGDYSKIALMIIQNVGKLN